MAPAIKLYIAGFAAAAATTSVYAKPVFADSRFGFLSPRSPQQPPPSQQAAPPPPSQGDPSQGPVPSGQGQPPQQPEGSPRVRNDYPRTTAAGFDPEPLEKGANLLRELDPNRDSKKVFEMMKKWEETKQAELQNKKAEWEIQKSQSITDRQRLIYEEQKNLAQQNAQIKAQMARYEDELARKRMEAEHQAQRLRNQELVKLQEESNARLEKARSATEEQIQAQRRQTEKERAEIERETLKVKAFAEAEARAHEAKLAEDVNRRMLVERINAEKESWVAAINTTFDHIGGGFKALLTDRNKLVVTVGGVTALAAGVYTTREGAKVIWGYVDRILGQPSLIRESSKKKYPWSGVASRALTTFSKTNKPGDAGKSGLGDVILHPSLQKRVEQLSKTTANTKAHKAPFRNMLFYGPPGTGKTMVARELAKKSGLEYALMTGGDVIPLGSQAVTKIHEIFDWASKSKKGVLLFIDEADAFLCKRNNTHMSEVQRSALNALLFRTGSQSRDIVLALATNRPDDLDSAVTNRIDEVLEFPLPKADERAKLLKLYLERYIVQAGDNNSGFSSLFKGKQQKIEVKGITDDVIQEAALKTEGFSGREIAKLMASVQAAVYGSEECVLDASMFREVVDYKVAEHQQRKKFAGKAN